MELELYLIEILHQTTTRYRQRLCCRRCILSKFYIKPQLSRYEMIRAKCCILSKFYIKPQLVRNYYGYSQVVSYRNSTSNHNPALSILAPRLVVSYRNSTSNHNSCATIMAIRRLYLIEILHQTTTPWRLLLFCF